MLTNEQIEEIREHLSNAQNPLFFFDNDQDGLFSFLLLQRYIGRGKGVPVKSFPELSVDYFRKVRELNADYIFILDKPVVSREFFKEIEQVNIPAVWIDHHNVDAKEVPGFVQYYNPLMSCGKSEPTTFLCYQISQKKEDLWIAVAGCIADKFIPSFYSDFAKEYPELSINTEDAFDIFYKSGIGKIARICGFALKDRTTNVINMLRFLMKCRSPYDVLEETSKNRFIHERFREINRKYQRLIEKAINSRENTDKILFFKYSGDLSISSDLSNELIYRFPGKVIVVAYVSGAKVNISVRGKNIREVVLRAIEDIDGAGGGGHEDAVGVKLKIEDLEIFKKNLEKFLIH